MRKGEKQRMNTEQFMEYLPLLIPIIIVQFVLLGITLHHILTHDNYKRGTRTLWLVVTIVLMEFVGPILYFVFGREDS
jgi:hypothetical protein